MNVRDLLIALVRFAITGERVDTGEIEKTLVGDKSATLFKVAKKHDVAHLVCFALEKLGVTFENNDTWQAFLKEKEQAVLRYEMIQADVDEICRCFDKEGIDYVPLKGAVLRALYPEPWMRTSCDIDILVREEDLDKAVGALVEGNGYTTDFKKTYHDVSLISPFGMHLELHHNIKENDPKYDELLTQVWDFAQKTDANSHKYLLTDEFLVFHLVAHAAYHFVGGGCGARTVLDLWIVTKQLEIDSEALRRLLQEAGLLKFYSQVLLLGEYWFGDENGDEQLIREMEKYILLGGVYGTKKQGAVSAQIKKGGRAKYFLSRIFIDYESLTLLYPVVKKHKSLVPFCQVARWFGAASKGKRINGEIKNVVGADKEKIDETKKLFEALEL